MLRTNSVGFKNAFGMSKGTSNSMGMFNNFEISLEEVSHFKQFSEI